MALVTLQTIFQDAFPAYEALAPAARPCPENRPRDHAVPDGGARGRSQPSCLVRHVVVRCPSPGARPVGQTLAARQPAGGRQGWLAARLMLRCGGGFRWRRETRARPGAGTSGSRVARGGRTRAVEKAFEFEFPSMLPLLSSPFCTFFSFLSAFVKGCVTEGILGLPRYS
jgi:hypothetical protein